MDNLSVIIMSCREEDVELLDQFFPFPEDHEMHRKRFEQQKNREGTYLIARLDNEPVGHLNIIWTGCKEEAVRNFTKTCPEFSAIGVRPEFRSRGIGTNLILTAENIAKEKGYKKSGIGVGVENNRAKQLYERLGYKDWGQGTYDDKWIKETENGEETVLEKAIFLVKNL